MSDFPDIFFVKVSKYEFAFLKGSFPLSFKKQQNLCSKHKDVKDLLKIFLKICTQATHGLTTNKRAIVSILNILALKKVA